MTTTENTLKIFENAGSKSWVLAYKTSSKAGSIISRYPDYFEVDEISSEDAAERLAETLESIGDGAYHLRHSREEKVGTKGYAEVFFKVGETRGYRGGNIGSTSPSNSMINGLGGIGEIIAEKIELDRLRREKEQLEEELSQYHAQEADPSGAKGLIGMITEAVGSIPNGKEIMGAALVNLMSRFLSPGVGVGVDAGAMPPPPQTQYTEPPQENTPKEMTPEENFIVENQKQIVAVMQRLYKLDNEILSTLEKMATKGEQNPAAINILKNFL
jgi:hypothetical protein